MPEATTPVRGISPNTERMLDPRKNEKALDVDVECEQGAQVSEPEAKAHEEMRKPPETRGPPEMRRRPPETWRRPPEMWRRPPETKRRLPEMWRRPPETRRRLPETKRLHSSEPKVTDPSTLTLSTWGRKTKGNRKKTHSINMFVK
jgi:hypothetical protein